MLRKSCRLNVTSILKLTVLAAAYYAIMLAAHSFWITGGSSLFHFDNFVMPIIFLPIAIVLSATVVTNSSKPKSHKQLVP